MNRIRGTYTTRREKGEEYTYECSWQVISHSVIWDAKVFRDGKPVGTLNGRFQAGEGSESPVVVVRVVEASIELQTAMA